ncbi:dipeptidase E [Bifidobacterium commune]|uniref:Dipeptidase E n=1 Tax=Bifidobacterium commune TaxID=1505727 RepID=A0A1C4H2N0_9BIFI|nr:Type 1 glutamine amidotransferase-like domain-containing protein [Bifidobacterium commune]MBB2955001.1 dipeptidase E [Bifidobacterium commune]SCC79227.1 dipeptidase E [Bifidobacterium commune]
MGRVILASRPLPAWRLLLKSLREHGGLYAGLRIAYIPTADVGQPSRCMRPAVRRMLRSTGFRVHELDVARADIREIRYILTTCDIIWVGGGNSFFLLHELRRSGAADLIVQQVTGGVTYVGVSAGAVVAGPDIGYIGQMDRRGVVPASNDVSGLHLVDFRVVPHLDNPIMGRAARAIAAAERREGHLIHALADAWTVIVKEHKPRILRHMV